MNSFWPAAFWSAIVIVLLSLPGSDLPPGGFFRLIPHFDKWIHFGMFALFVILWNWAIAVRLPQSRQVKSFVLVTLVGILVGYLMELVQKYMVTNRDYDMWDVVADAAGAAGGLVFSLIRFRKK